MNCLFRTFSYCSLLCLSGPYWFEGVLHISWIQLPNQIYALKILPPSLWVLIQSLKADISWTKILNSNVFHFLKFFLDGQCAFVLSYEIFAIPSADGYSLMWVSRHITTWNCFFYIVWGPKIHFLKIWLFNWPSTNYGKDHLFLMAL